MSGATQPVMGSIVDNNVRIRSGPGAKEYDPPVAALSKGAIVRIVGRNIDSSNNVWWKIVDPVGWVHSDYVKVSGCAECVATAALPISNRGLLLNQGQNGWTYLLELGRNTGNFTAFDTRGPYEGVDCYRASREEYVRICAKGNIHPGTEGRIAYRWNSSIVGAVTVHVHAHKIDTHCGDGVWIGTFLGQSGGRESKVGEFFVVGGDNTERSESITLRCLGIRISL